MEENVSGCFFSEHSVVSECNDFEYCKITSMTSYSRVTSSMTSPIDAP